MLADLILIAIAVLIIAFVWAFWLRTRLARELAEVSAQESVMRRELWRQRDTVPLLLEAYRKSTTVDANWQNLLAARAALHQDHSVEDEWNFKKTLDRFILDTSLHTLDYLNAKKDIQDLSTIIEQQRAEYVDSITRYNQLRKQFPYSLASGIFGFRSLEA